MTHLSDLPESARTVHQRLQWGGEAAFSELHRDLSMPRSTLTVALRQLRESDLVSRRDGQQDARRTIYSAKPDDATATEAEAI